MSDPLRTDAARPGERHVDRDARIEALLVGGLDHYIAGDYERAIHVWTRVLFLDRGHARARAYIERARGALGEHQRESEELLDRAVAAFERGDVRNARRLLTSAVDRGGHQDVALTVLDRIDRLEGAKGPDDRRGASRARAAGRAGDAAADVPEPKQTSPMLSIGVLVLLAGAAAYVATSWESVESLLRLRPPAPVSVLDDPEEAVPLPSPSEFAIAEARTLFERGRVYDALDALDGVGLGDPLREEADRLRSRIQGALLIGATAGTR